MSRLIDENTIIKMLNTMDRYTSEELTLCDTDETFPKNEVFIVDDVFEGLDELPSALPEPCEDTVSRQYILGALAEYIDEYGEVDAEGNHDPKWCAMKEAEMVVKEAPSVEPEHDENELNFMQPHKRIPVQLVVSSDCISRQAAIDAFEDTTFTKNEIRRRLLELPTAQPERTEIIRCKDCNKASKCYGDVIMRSRGGGNIYCPLEFCSEAERRTDELRSENSR